MADEYVNVTVHGKTFDMKVPKGASDDYIKTAATNYHDLTYGPVVKQPPVVNSPDFQRMEQTGDQGFLSSIGKNLSDKWHQVTEHPLDTIRSIMPSTEIYNSKDPKRPGGPEWDPFYDVPFKDAIFKATHGNILGAVGDIAPDVAITGALSPKIRGAIGGGIRGIADTISDIKINPRTSIPTAIGAGIGGMKAGWPGGLIGAVAGAIAPEVPNIIKEGMRGAVVGAADKPLIPKLMRDHETPPNHSSIENATSRIKAAPRPNEYPQIPGRVLVTPPPAATSSVAAPSSATPSAQPPTFNPQLERGPINMPGPGLSMPPAQLRLGPATQIQMPSSTFGTYVRPKELPLPEHGFWRGPSDTPLKPGPEEYFAPRRTNFPIKPDDAPLKPADASKVYASKDEVQQVPAATRTVDEALPNKDALKVNRPQEENVQNKKSEPKQEETKKTYITRENLYNIAKEMGEVPTSLARWMLKNNYDLEKPKFGNAWDEERPTKIQPSETKLKTKEAQANANHALFSKMVPEIAKQHPEWF